MNKETRTFIWGLLVFIPSTIALYIHLVEIIKGDYANILKWVAVLICFIGANHGIDKIKKTTD